MIIFRQHRFYEFFSYQVELDYGKKLQELGRFLRDFKEPMARRQEKVVCSHVPWSL